MRQFLREAWELWYWAMFCPSQLQERMNTWAPANEQEGKKTDTDSSDILFVKAHPQFICQYFLVVSCLSVPLLCLVFSGQTVDSFLVPIAIMTAYGTSVWSVPIGLHWPLLFALEYWANPDISIQAFGEASMVFPPLLQLAVGLTSGAVTLGLTSLIVWRSCQNHHRGLARTLFFSGSILSICMGSWLATHNFVPTLLLTGISGFFLFLFGDHINFDSDAGFIADDVIRFVTGFVAVSVAGGVAVGVTGGVTGFVTRCVAVGVAIVIAAGVTGILRGIITVGIAGIVTGGVVGGVASGVAVGIAGSVASGVAVGIAGGVTGGVAGSVAGMAVLPLPLFLSACGLISFSLAPVQQIRFGLIATAVLTGLGLEKLGGEGVLAILVGLILYFRIFPDYINTFQRSLLGTRPGPNSFHSNPLNILYRLPPYTTELLWLPLPNHAHILAAVFRINDAVAINTFQKMQALPLPGFQRTIQQALPHIVADQMVAITTLPELLFTTSHDHPFLPLLLPTFDVPTSKQEKPSFSRPINSNINAELFEILPRLQAVARDIDAALKAGNAALQERGLERIFNHLNTLSAQLPRLGFNPKVVKRWQQVIERWQQVIELDLKQNQTDSYGELLNPFIFGNPLKTDRSHLFKGRLAFADEIVRQILDRNRPTLVLHGPRRCGKSSFLLNLPRLLPSDVLPVYLDMQSAATTTDAASFCQGLTRAIRRDSRSQGVDLPAIPPRQTFLDSPYIALENWLEQALPNLGDRRLLLNLDEFEKIGSAIKAGKFSEDFLDELRHLIQHYDHLGFLFSGVQTLDELAPHWSDYFISVVPIEMLYLEPNEARELLEDPDPDFTLGYGAGIVDRILDLTRCQPYLLQLLGSALVTQANQNQTQLVTTPLLDAAIQPAFTNGEPYFTNVWREFTGATPAEVTAGQDLLLALAQGEQPSLSGDELAQRALRRMQRYHLLELQQERYCFEIPLVEMWVRSRAVRG